MISGIYTPTISSDIEENKPTTSCNYSKFNLPALHVFLHLLFFLSSHFFSWKSLVAKRKQPKTFYLNLVFRLFHKHNNDSSWGTLQTVLKCSSLLKHQCFNDALLFILMPSCSFRDLTHHTERKKEVFFSQSKARNSIWEHNKNNILFSFIF